MKATDVWRMFFVFGSGLMLGIAMPSIAPGEVNERWAVLGALIFAVLAFQAVDAMEGHLR